MGAWVMAGRVVHFGPHPSEAHLAVFQQTGERIATSKTFYTEQTEPLLIRGGLEGKKIIQITSGQQHSVALDDEGYCYAWGFGGRFLKSCCVGQNT